MIPWRHAPAGVAAVLAAATLGLLVYQQRAHGAEIRALTKELAALREDVADRTASATNAPPPPFARCTFDSETVQAIAGAVGQVVGRGGPPVPTPNARAATPDPQGLEPARTKDQEAALATATEAAGQIVKQGRATPADLSRLGQQIALAGESPETDALRAQISQAINDGKLVLDRHPGM
jgi:hypothetical protein